MIRSVRRKQRKRQEQRKRVRRNQLKLERERDLPSLPDVMELANKAFRKRFGRDMGPGDPIEWDPDTPGDVPTPMPFIKSSLRTFETFQRMPEYPRAMLYAYAHTGFMNHPSASGRTDLPEAEIVEYEDLIDEFAEMDEEEQQAALEVAPGGARGSE